MDSTGGSWPEGMPTLDDVRSELGALIPRLADSPILKLAAVGVFRRSGRLTSVGQSYFDLRSSIAGPQQPDHAVAAWLSEWIKGQNHPLLEGLVHTWTREEFGGAAPSAELMLRTHLTSVEEDRPIVAMTGAFELDGVELDGYAADTEDDLWRVVQIEDLFVLVCLPTELSRGTPLLTIH